MKNFLGEREIFVNVLQILLWLEQWKLDALVVKGFKKRKAVQDFTSRCFSLCLHTVKNSDLWLSEASSGWKRMWCFSRIQSLQMLVAGFQGADLLRISHVSVYPTPSPMSL